MKRRLLRWAMLAAGIGRRGGWMDRRGSGVDVESRGCEEGWIGGTRGGWTGMGGVRAGRGE